MAERYCWQKKTDGNSEAGDAQNRQSDHLATLRGLSTMQIRKYILFVFLSRCLCLFLCLFGQVMWMWAVWKFYCANCFFYDARPTAAFRSGGLWNFWQCQSTANDHFPMSSWFAWWSNFMDANEIALSYCRENEHFQDLCKLEDEWQKDITFYGDAIGIALSYCREPLEEPNKDVACFVDI